MLIEKFNKYKTFIFDLDGTILLQDELFSNASPTLKTLQELEKQILFISNNTTSSTYDYSKLFNDEGITVSEKQFTIATEVLVDAFKYSSGCNFYLIGEMKLRSQLEKIGMKYSENSLEVEFVIISLDRFYTEEKYKIAKKCLLNRAKLYAANIDRSCPTKSGEIIDAGEIIERLEVDCGITLVNHFGKPSENFYNHLKKKISRPVNECVIIGDRLETDIQLGNKFGIDTIRVLTGVNNLYPTNGVKPTYVLEDISDLLVKHSTIS